MAEGVPVDDSNLMVRAAPVDGRAGGDARLKKNLPNAAGLGGGSSDAAATLQAISRMTGQPIPESAITLGADVPVCLMGRAARMSGIGDKLESVAGMPMLNAVLVNPGRPVPTKLVFERLTCKENPPMPEQLPTGLSAAELTEWLGSMRNDLEAPAMKAEPVIAQVFETLSKTPGCLLTRMSGSGGTCFGIYKDRETANSAAGRLKEQNPAWWVSAVRLNSSKT